MYLLEFLVEVNFFIDYDFVWILLINIFYNKVIFVFLFLLFIKFFFCSLNLLFFLYRDY